MRTASDQAPAAQESLERGADNSVRARRIEQGLSRVQLAASVEVGKSTIAGIENGHHRPSLELARKIAEGLHADVGKLFRLRECACGCGGLMVDQARLGSSARFLSGHNCRGPEHATAVTRAHRARRVRLGIPEEKTCKGCGRTFTRSEFPNQPLVHWLAREHCSFTCAHGPPVEPRVCARDGCEQIFKPSWSADTSLRHCSASCAQQDRWERLTDIPEAMLRALPPRARQRKLGKVKGREHGKLGSRPPVSVTDEQRIEILRLKAQNWGRQSIANRLSVSEWAVRKVLSSS